MRLPQFSLKALAGAVAFAAVACCTLVYASSAWSSTIYTVAIVFLAFATLAAVYSHERARAYWLGCAFCGWLYLLLVFGPLSGTQQVNTMGQLNVESELATTHLARWLYGTVLPKLRTPPSVTQVAGSGSIRLPGSLVLDTAAGTRQMPITQLGFTIDQDASGSPRVTTPIVAAPYYPDETSFIRVSHALWTWLFALAGGIAGRWLYGRCAAAATQMAAVG